MIRGKEEEEGSGESTAAQVQPLSAAFVLAPTSQSWGDKISGFQYWGSDARFLFLFLEFGILNRCPAYGRIMRAGQTSH